MREYVLLSEINKHFKVSHQTVNKHLQELKIKKKTHNNRVYIKEEEFNALYKKLELSNRVKKIAEIDFEEVEAESHREELLKKEIESLNKEVTYLKDELNFKNKELESFHGIINTSAMKIDSLEKQLLLLEESKDIALKDKDNEIKSFEDEIKAKEIEIVEERKSKEIIVEELNKYKNMTFKDKLVNLFKK